jgi:hypothetical protein
MQIFKQKKRFKKKASIGGLEKQSNNPNLSCFRFYQLKNVLMKRGIGYFKN